VSFFRVINNLFRFNRTNWKAVSLCFLAATVFWFFNALNKNYAANVRFPLQFEFDQQRFVPAKQLPKDVYVNVSGKGWDLLRKNLGLKLPTVLIPLERPVDTKKIVGSTLPPLLASQLGSLKINHIVTDTLYVSIEQKDSIRMKVIIDLNMISFREGHGRISPVVVLPDSIEFLGPKSRIRLLPDSILVSLPEKKLGANFREQIEIKTEHDEFIRHKPQSVEVMFEVGEVVEIEQKLKLELTNIPAAARVNLGNDSIACRVQIPRNRADDYAQAAAAIKAVLDLSDARSGQRKTLPAILGLPSYALLVKTDSIRVRLY
jgi:hypothetical protein